jgi:hypothetical protein
MMNSSNMLLYFVKEIDGFEEEGEADEPRQDQDRCKHSFVLSSYCQMKCPAWSSAHSQLIHNNIWIDVGDEGGLPPYQNGMHPIKMKIWRAG